MDTGFNTEGRGGHLRKGKSTTADVFCSVFGGEAKIPAQTRTNNIPIQKTGLLLVVLQFSVQARRQCCFTSAGKAGYPKYPALLAKKFCFQQLISKHYRSLYIVNYLLSCIRCLFRCGLCLIWECLRKSRLLIRWYSENCQRLFGDYLYRIYEK